MTLIRPDNWEHKDAKKLSDFEYDDGITVPLYEVRSFQALTQLIGYVKHINPKWDIYYRGQGGNYKTMRPSLFRKVKNIGKPKGEDETRIAKRSDLITGYIRNYKQKLEQLAIPEFAIEPTLQHYGFNTRWIDLVDNVWIALWFGAFEERRRTSGGTTFVLVEPRSGSGKQYFYLISSDAKNASHSKHGYYTGENTCLIDLRKSCPSQFIRPHAQHGLLMRRKRLVTENDKELTDLVACIIELDLQTVQRWIGTSELLSPNYIYPSPYHDIGYSNLINDIKCNVDEAISVGSITHLSY